MPRRSKTDVVQVNLRLREDFRQRLVREAERTGRSFNAELVKRLEDSFDRMPADQVLELSAEVLKRVSDLLEPEEFKARRQKLATLSEEEVEAERAKDVDRILKKVRQDAKEPAKTTK